MNLLSEFSRNIGGKLRFKEYRCVECKSHKGYKYKCKCKACYCSKCVVKYINYFMNKPYTLSGTYETFQIPCFNEICDKQLLVCHYINNETFSKLHDKYACSHCHIENGYNYSQSCSCGINYCLKCLKKYINTNLIVHPLKTGALTYYDIIPNTNFPYYQLKCPDDNCIEIINVLKYQDENYLNNLIEQHHQCQICYKNNGATYPCSNKQYVCYSCVYKKIVDYISTTKNQLLNYDNIHIPCLIKGCNEHINISRYMDHFSFYKLTVEYKCQNCHINYGNAYKCACDKYYCDQCVQMYLNNYMNMPLPQPGNYENYRIKCFNNFCTEILPFQKYMTKDEFNVP
jgi:hypothetical protein